MDKHKCYDEDYNKIKEKLDKVNQNIKYLYIKGPKGDKGEKGDKGDDGPATIEVGITETTDYDTLAMVENVGTNKEVVLNFKIPKGSPGEKGDKGDIGPRGLPGEIGISEVITIDGTETIEANEEASVQDDFDRNIHHLTFYIPKGEKGDKGDTGEKGDIGPRGLPGEIGISEVITIDGTETIEPNEEASVQDDFDRNIHHLTFYIPKGEKGDTGDVGIEAYGIRYTNTDENFNVNAFNEAIIPLEITGPSRFIKYNSSYSVEIQIPGVYQITYSLNLATTTDSRFNISVKAGGITIPGSNLLVESKANIPINVFNTSMHTLLENEEVTLVISPFTNTELIFDDTTNASLSIVKLNN